MKTKLAGLAIVACLLGACEAEDKLYIKKDMIAATGQLVLFSDGQWRGRCTTTAFERKQNLYRFITAAHCVANYNMATGRTVLKPNSAFFIFFENSKGMNVIHNAALLAVGDMDALEDFAILEAEINTRIPTVPIGQSDPEIGDKISLITNARINFMEFFSGQVSSEEVPVNFFTNTGQNLKGYFTLQGLTDLGNAMGASGSVIVSHRQNAIVGVLTASFKNEQSGRAIIAMPISKFKKFYEKFQRGEYKLHKEDENTCFEEIPIDDGSLNLENDE